MSDPQTAPECRDCADAEQNPRHGIYMGACLRCRCRMLAHSKAAFDSAKAGRVTPEFQRQARQAFGDDYQQRLPQVKAWSQRIKGAPA